MNQVWRWPLAMVTGFLSLGGLCMLFAYFQEDENAAAPTTIRLIEASLRREDVADRTNFRLLLCALLPISSPVLAKKRTPQLSVHVLSNTSTRNAYNLETIPLALILLSKSMFSEIQHFSTMKILYCTYIIVLARTVTCWSSLKITLR